jgi:hypothetical protein
MQTNPLDGLHDIIAPNQVKWWPLAPAWGGIIALLFLTLCTAIYIFYKKHKFKKPKRYAIALSQSEQNPQQLHIILKRLVLEYYDKRLAAQPTAKWCTTLNTLTGLNFTEQEILSLYNPNQKDTTLCEKFRQGIKQFKVKEPVHV